MTSTPVVVPRQSASVIPALTGIRAIAAVWVLIEHFRYELFGLFPGTEVLAPWIVSGYLGVEVFFVLSGFIISYNYADRMSTLDGPRTRDFLVNRFARIYPMHLATLLAVAFLVAAAAATGTSINGDDIFTPWSFVGNVLLLQALPGLPAWNGPAWSISAEAFAYAAFPLIALVLAKLGLRSAAAGAVVWLGLGTALMMILRFTYDTSSLTSPMIFARIGTEFVAGCLIWKAWDLAGRPQERRWDGVAIGAVVATVAVLAFVGDQEGFGLIVAPLLALFVLGCACAAGPVRWLLSTRVMRHGGLISYSLYMVHFVVLMVVGQLLPWESFEDSSVPIRVGLMVFYYGVCFLAAWVAYRFIETPGRKYVQRVAARRV